jgi:hypothetical protein
MFDFNDVYFDPTNVEHLYLYFDEEGNEGALSHHIIGILLFWVSTGI